MSEKKPKDGSESHFASYLNPQSLPWEYEKEVGGKNPDFFVECEPQAFVAEVYDPTIRLPRQLGWFTSYPALRKAFKDAKRKQIAAVKKTGLPYVGVIGRANSDMEVAPFLMAGAMFGNLAYSVPVSADPLAAPREGKTVFDKGGSVQPKRFRGVSAVAVMQIFNPTLWKVEQAWDERLGKRKDVGPTLTDEQITRELADRARIMNEVANHMAETGDFLPECKLVRLVVLHNPFATHPLDMSTLAGPHDEQWQGVEIDGVLRYGPYWRGPLIHETGQKGNSA